MMAPNSSPQGILGKPVKVKRLNQRAKALVFALLALGFFLLLGTILGKNTVQSAEKVENETLNLSSAAATPPQSLSKSQTAAADKFRTNQPPSGATALANGDLYKENMDFQKELRRNRQQAYMSRLSQYDSAIVSPMNIESLDSKNKDQLEATPAMRSAEESPFSRLAAALGGASSPGMTGASQGDPNMQAQKQDFAQRQLTSGYLPFKKRQQLSPYEVKTGSVIPAVMISGINSDLPGQIIAQVKETVYDTATGQYPLIPQGTRLVGSYDSFVAIGQEGALVAWNRLVFPDGATLELLNMPGQDAGGYAGFRDIVNNHYLRTYGNAILLSLVGAGYQISQPKQTGEGLTATNRDILAGQLGQQLSQISGEKIRQSMQIQPTIEIRPGYEFIVAVNRDMILEPYTETP